MKDTVREQPLCKEHGLRTASLQRAQLKGSLFIKGHSVQPLHKAHRVNL